MSLSNERYLQHSFSLLEIDWKLQIPMGFTNIYMIKIKYDCFLSLSRMNDLVFSLFFTLSQVYPTNLATTTNLDPFTIKSEGQ